MIQMSSQLGRILIIAGIGLVVLGLIFLAVGHIPFLGRLPGDIHIKGKKWKVYFPITTCIVISIVLSLVFWLISHFRGR